MSNVRYNELSLPVKIEISTPDLTGTNEYFYTATGTKLHVVHQWESNIFNSIFSIISKTTTDYCGNKIYENGKLTKILIDNGYIDMTDGQQQYYCYVKDHLGNIRAVQGNNGVAIQSTQYYPYGMAYQDRVFGQEKQPYLFNGKELDNISGLNWYDFSARYYDDVVPHFTTPDPMAEKYYSISPYAAFGGNPLRFVDPSGMRALDFQYHDWLDNQNEGEGMNTSIFIDEDNKVIEHRDDGDNSVYVVGNQQEWEKNGKSKDEVEGVLLKSRGVEAPWTTYKPGDTYEYFPSWYTDFGDIMRWYLNSWSKKLELPSDAESERWLRENIQPVIMGLLEFNPLIGIPNGASGAIRGEDMYGNKVEGASRVLAGASVLTAAGGNIAKLAGYGEKTIMKLIDYVLSINSAADLTIKEYNKQNNKDK